MLYNRLSSYGGKVFPSSSIQDIRVQNTGKKLYYGMKNFNAVHRLGLIKIAIKQLKQVNCLVWLKSAANLVVLLGEMPNGHGAEKRQIRFG